MFHTLQQNEEKKIQQSEKAIEGQIFLMSFIQSRDFFEALSELPDALLLRQIYSFLNFFGRQNMLCAGEQIIGRV